MGAVEMISANGEVGLGPVRHQLIFPYVSKVGIRGDGPSSVLELRMVIDATGDG